MARMTKAERRQAQDEAGQRDWGVYLKQLRASMQLKFNQRNLKITDVYNRRFFKQAPIVPDAFRATAAEFRSPFVSDLLRRAQAILGQTEDGAPNLPRVHVTPVKVGPKALDNATLREKWWTAALRKMNERNNIYGTLVDALCCDGQAVWKCVLRAHSWAAVQRGEDEPAESYSERVKAKRRAEFPFFWEHVPTNTYYPITDTEVMEVTRRETLPLMRQYNLVWKDGELHHGQYIGDRVQTGVFGQVDATTTSAIPTTCLFTEYWNETNFVYMVEGVVVRVGTHNYGRPPYFSALAFETASKDPADQVNSLAAPILSLQDMIDSFITIKMNWAYLNGFPAGLLEPINEESIGDATEQPVIEWKPGKTIQPPAGWRWKWAEAPHVGGDLTALGDWLKAVMDQVSLAPILYGFQAGGANASGVTTNSMIAVAKSLFGPGVQNMSRGFNEMGAFVLHMIEDTPVLQEGVPIWHKGGSEWLELGPEDIDGYYEFEHHLEPVIPAERMARGLFYADAQARGAITMNEYREKGLGYENPDEIDLAVRIEQFRNRPEYQQMLWAEVARRIAAANPNPQAQGTPPALSLGPGGPGVPQMAGIQQPMQAGGPMAAQPAPQGGPLPMSGAPPVGAA